MYPESLAPSSVEKFIINDGIIEIPKCFLTFDKWIGEPINETFGGKPIVSFGNKPMFAELAIMNHFVADGWNARWIETYAMNNAGPIYLTEWKDDKYKKQVHKPISDVQIQKLLGAIAKKKFQFLFWLLGRAWMERWKDFIR